MTDTTETVILTLSSMLDGTLRQYATDAAAEAAIARFGRAVSAERIEDTRGVRWLVTCATQRGDGGAFRMHSMACNFMVPVHIA